MINRIRDIRREKGMTLADLAEACRPPTTPQTIGRLETGMRNLSIKWMDRIAAALGVHVSTVREWRGLFAEGGTASLQRRKPPGRPSRIGIAATALAEAILRTLDQPVQANEMARKVEEFTLDRAVDTYLELALGPQAMRSRPFAGARR